jgi:threonine dehydratase
VHAFDQPETLLGQGTLGLELADQAPEIDTVLVPVGGGGLIGGIAAWYAGRMRIIGVAPAAAPTLFRALEAGRPVDAEAGVAALLEGGYAPAADERIAVVISGANTTAVAFD